MQVRKKQGGKISNEGLLISAKAIDTRQELATAKIAQTFNTNQFTEPSGNKLPKANYDDNKTTAKIAQTFNTNRSYVSDAIKLVQHLS